MMLVRRRTDRGASAVEFALVLPLFLLVIAGVVDFGRALFTQVVLTNAAREGARAAIFTTSTPGPSVRASTAAPGVSPLAIQVIACPSTSTTAVYATVVAAVPTFDWIMLKPVMNMFGAGGALPTSLSGKAVMKCGG
ncbi:TadE/TadG family type IV pilus assembly protein [Intrasporangium chromatireducens]|uniref:TadE/TadG family type IV pilus assembly protein n=1 Tax=Intrasporangium chromatireducens TaxID=1386088 RepID=UPI0004AC55FC|nr:TadE family protein [Intrasporangium chromatireducens]